MLVALRHFETSFRVNSRLRAAVDGAKRRIGCPPNMGTAGIGGMLAASVLGIFFVPEIFYLWRSGQGAGKGARVGSVAGGLPTPAEGTEMKHRGEPTKKSSGASL